MRKGSFDLDTETIHRILKLKIQELGETRENRVDLDLQTINQAKIALLQGLVIQVQQGLTGEGFAAELTQEIQDSLLEIRLCRNPFLVLALRVKMRTLEDVLSWVQPPSLSMARHGRRGRSLFLVAA